MHTGSIPVGGTKLQHITVLPVVVQRTVDYGSLVCYNLVTAFIAQLVRAHDS